MARSSGYNATLFTLADRRDMFATTSWGTENQKFDEIGGCKTKKCGEIMLLIFSIFRRDCLDVPRCSPVLSAVPWCSCLTLDAAKPSLPHALLRFLGLGLGLHGTLSFTPLADNSSALQYTCRIQAQAAATAAHQRPS